MPSKILISLITPNFFINATGAARLFLRVVVLSRIGSLDKYRTAACAAQSLDCAVTLLVQKP